MTHIGAGLEQVGAAAAEIVDAEVCAAAGERKTKASVSGENR
jgi:hypothetical protein